MLKSNDIATGGHGKNAPTREFSCILLENLWLCQKSSSPRTLTLAF